LRAPAGCRRLPSRAHEELERFFLATDALENKKLEFLGWGGPAVAVKKIKRLAREPTDLKDHGLAMPNGIV
jgi:hypothetical protein